MKKFLIIFSISGFLAVALGAFGAHALSTQLEPKYFTIFQTAVQYQFYHTLALGLTAVLLGRESNKWLKRAAWFFVLGILIFSGSLYFLALGNGSLNWLGAVTPVGGVCFLAGWGSLVGGVCGWRDA